MLQENPTPKSSESNERPEPGQGLTQAHFFQLWNLSQRINSSLDLPAVLQTTAEVACELVGARYAAVLVVDESGHTRELGTHGATSEDVLGVGHPPLGPKLLATLSHSRTPIRLADASTHPDFSGLPTDHPHVKTLLGVALRYGEDVEATLVLGDKKQGPEFTAADEANIALIAPIAAAAIRRARLHGRTEMERRRLDAILNDAPNGMVYVDRLTYELYANRRAEEMLQCSLSQPDGLSLLEKHCLAPDGTAIPPGEHPLRRALRGELIPGDEMLIGSPGATPLPVVCSASPIRDGGDEITGAVIRFRDITRMKEAQRYIEKLATERGELLGIAEQERQRLEALIDTSPVGVIVAEPGTGRVVLMNREAERILGFPHTPFNHLSKYEQAAVYRRPDGSAYQPNELPLQRALYYGEIVRAEEVRFELPNQHTVPTLMDATPVYSSSGEITSAIAVIQDISPLEEMEKLRSEFLGLVSYELKTPLTAIKGSAATALGSSRPLSTEETRDLFQIIDEQADRLRDLVDNILDMTRIEAGTLVIRTEPLDLKEALGEALGAFSRAGGTQEVVLSGVEGAPRIQADRHRVIQVLGNLLSNAAKFSPATSTIAIDVERQAEVVAVHIKDAGRGIPLEKLPHLFRSFSQVHDEGQRRLSGSGLGLAICKGIIDAHGGRIWVSSQGDGMGATFSFTLPVTEEKHIPTSPKTSRRAELMGRVSRSGERTRILAVNDEPGVLRLLQRALREAGYTTVVTTDPSRAIPLLESEEPDMVILDVVFAGASGFDLLEQIRESFGVPVIILTGSNVEEDAVRALKMGADDYITKPFSPNELLARIEATLRRSALPDTLEVRAPLIVEDLAMDFAERRVTVAGEPVALSATEYKLLYHLATNAGRVLTHDQILRLVWGPDYSGETDLVRSFIRNLRRKLGDDARQPRYIFTEPQVGYRMPRP